MKRGVLAFLLLVTMCGAQGLLDEPIKGDTPLEVFSAMQRIHTNLPEEDARAFSHGITGLTSESKVWRKEAMTEPERDKFVVAVVRGMTPRQAIIIGSMLRALFYRTEYLEQKASSPNSEASWADGKVHAELMEDIAARYLARYTKEANQSVQRTGPSARR